MTKTTATAHAIQGLIKYHGLRDKNQRLPFHDSISVCVEKLTTTATIDFDEKYREDKALINSANASAYEVARIIAVIEPLRRLARRRMHFRLESRNSLSEGKGLGFSAAAFASIALAAATAMRLALTHEQLSEFARLGAGSASRSVVGGFSIWYASRNGRSFARQIATPTQMPLAMGIVPIPSQIKTDRAHEESEGSPLFKARLRDVRNTLPKMVRAIQRADLDQVCRLAESDSLSLHAVTMTGKGKLLLMAPETIQIIQRIVALREEEHLPVWYSLDTGPSVFVNTHQNYVEKVCSCIEDEIGIKILRSAVGGPARLTDEHLF